MSKNYKTVHGTDVVLKVLDDREEFEKNFTIDANTNLTQAALGKIKYIEPKKSIEIDVEIGDRVYFDARFCTEITQLNIVVIDIDKIIMKKQ
jgi:co-chaperonin GroES (HSP10)